MSDAVEEHMSSALTSSGFRLVTLAEFAGAADVPEGLRERVRVNAAAEGIEGDVGYVVYDPDDDAEGFCIVGPDRLTLLKEWWDHVGCEVEPTVTP